MNTNIQNRTTPFQERNLETAGFQPRPTRFSTEIEGEGMEVFLRGFLVACLLAALTICTFHLPVGHDNARLPTLPDSAATMAEVVKPISAPSIAAPKVSLF